MKKHINFTSCAWKFYNEQSVAVRAEFKLCLDTLEREGKLEFPQGKKIAPNLYEIRVKVTPNQYRLFYCYVEPDSVLVLSGFVKKTQQTPKCEINKAKQIRKVVLK